jgi:hypothetical protein
MSGWLLGVCSWKKAGNQNVTLRGKGPESNTFSNYLVYSFGHYTVKTHKTTFLCSVFPGLAFYTNWKTMALQNTEICKAFHYFHIYQWFATNLQLLPQTYNEQCYLLGCDVMQSGSLTVSQEQCTECILPKLHSAYFAMRIVTSLMKTYSV